MATRVQTIEMFRNKNFENKRNNKSFGVNERELLILHTVIAVASADCSSNGAPVAHRSIKQLVFERTRVIQVSRRAGADWTFVPSKGESDFSLHSKTLT